MTEKRKEQIKQEAQRRLNDWLDNSTLDEMTAGGSLMSFDMSLGLCGYPFDKPDWMKAKKFNKFVNEVEFHSDEYDKIINELFYKASHPENLN